MCPSITAFAITLGPTNPSLIFIAKETLVFRRAGFSPALRLLVPTFLLLDAPVWVTPLPSLRVKNTLLPLADFIEEAILKKITKKYFFLKID
jgi:hypothetical protein